MNTVELTGVFSDTFTLNRRASKMGGTCWRWRRITISASADRTGSPSSSTRSTSVKLPFTCAGSGRNSVPLPLSSDGEEGTQAIDVNAEDSKLRWSDPGASLDDGTLHIQLDSPFTWAAAFTGLLLFNLAAYGTDQDMAQRMLTCRNERRGGWSARSGSYPAAM